MVGAGFFSHYLIDPYHNHVQHHVNINVLSVLLNKTFPSFLPSYSSVVNGMNNNVNFHIKYIN